MNVRSPYRRIKKDYQSKNLKNPFYRKKEKGRGSKFWKWLFVGSIAVLASLIWFFLASPFWKIENVVVSGLTRMSDQEIKNLIFSRSENTRMLMFTESNYFLFQTESAKQEILDKYNFSDLSIKKKLPRTIELKINERPYSFIYRQGSEHFYCSSEGYIIKEIPVSPEDFSKYFILENKSDSVSIGEKNKLNLKDDYLNFILNLNSILLGYADLPIEKFVIDQELNSVIVKFKDGPAVYFSTKNDGLEQVQNLALVKKEKIKDNFSKTNYIDLRYGSKIFIN